MSCRFASIGAGEDTACTRKSAFTGILLKPCHLRNQLLLQSMNPFSRCYMLDHRLFLNSDVVVLQPAKCKDQPGTAQKQQGHWQKESGAQCISSVRLPQASRPLSICLMVALLTFYCFTTSLQQHPVNSYVASQHATSDGYNEVGCATSSEVTCL